MHVAQAQFKKLTQLVAVGHAFGFICHQKTSFAQFPQIFGNVVVLCAHTRTGIEHEDDHIRLCHGLAGLFGHFFVNAGFGVRLETTCVDDDVLEFALLTIAVVAIASRVFVRRLNKVDLPTFGRPTRAKTGFMLFFLLFS
jgi:hypothetical protein